LSRRPDSDGVYQHRIGPIRVSFEQAPVQFL
jgi:hypothetical protein